MDEENSTKKIKTASLVLMIFSSIFGFSNSLTAYYQMGYASIDLVYCDRHLILPPVGDDVCRIRGLV